jgi:hypothetical protein
METASKTGFFVLLGAMAICAVFVFRLAYVISFGPRFRIVENSVGGGVVPPVMRPFVEAMRSAQESVLIFAAELDLRLFSFPVVIEAFEKAIANGAKIEILCGPVFLVHAVGSMKGKNPLWEHFKDRSEVVFYLRTKRRNVNHGTIVDAGRYLIVEDYHGPAAKERRNYVYRNQQKSAGAREWIARFDALKADPDTLPLTEEEFEARKVEFDETPGKHAGEERKLLDIYDERGYSYKPPENHSGFLDEEGTVLVSV